MQLKINLLNNIQYKYRFLIYSISIGIVCSLLYCALDITNYAKQKFELREFVAACNAENEQRRALAPSGSGFFAVLCEPKEIGLYANNGPWTKYQSNQGKSVEERESEAIKITMQKLIYNTYLEIYRLERGIVGSFLASVGASILFGLIPIFWDFFLNRIAEISRAVGGINNH